MSSTSHARGPTSPTAAGPPDSPDTAFATKPELAARMIARFLDAGHHAPWVTGDEVYGGNPKLRTALEERTTDYVLAVARSHEVTTRGEKFRAEALAKKLPKRAWQKLSAGAYAKGQRFYDWAVIALPDPHPGHRHLLIRRNRTTGELAYYRGYSPRLVPLTVLVRVAGSRWRVEETFQSGKGLAGLDEHQVRRYASWSRWVTLAMGTPHGALGNECAVLPAADQAETGRGRGNTPAAVRRQRPYLRPAAHRRAQCLRHRAAPGYPPAALRQPLPVAPALVHQVCRHAAEQGYTFSRPGRRRPTPRSR